MLPYILLVYYNGHGILQIRNKETERIKLFSIVFTTYFFAIHIIILHNKKLYQTPLLKDSNYVQDA